MKTLIYLFLLVPFILRAQEEQGVRFEEGSNWTAIQAKAKRENKYIFMDCYTTWCAPCNYMKDTIFPEAESGAYFNANFISVAVQLDSTQKDNDIVKGWYADARAIKQKYNIFNYPAFIIFSPDGQAVSRIVGRSATAREFIGRIKATLQPDKQYYTLLGQYKQGKRHSTLLLQLANAAMDAYDQVTSVRIGNEYMSSQNDLYTKDNLELILRITNTSRDKGFSVLLHDPAKADKVLGSGRAEQKLQAIILREEITPLVHQDAAPDWTAVQQEVSRKYPGLADEITTRGKVLYYQSKSEWLDFQKAVTFYVGKYGAAMDPGELNDDAWTVFQHCTEMSCLGEALRWSKLSLQKNEIPPFIDTYANILYKMGQKEEAVGWEEKAAKLVSTENRTVYMGTIDKMKKGEKTWD